MGLWRRGLKILPLHLPRPGSPHLAAQAQAARSQHEPSEPGAALTSLSTGSELGRSQAGSVPALSLLCSSSNPLPSQHTDPGGYFNSCSFTIKPGKPKQGNYSCHCFSEISSLLYFLLQMFKGMHQQLLPPAVKRLLPAAVSAGPRPHDSPQSPRNKATTATAKLQSREKGGFRGVIILIMLSFFVQNIRCRLQAGDALLCLRNAAASQGGCKVCSAARRNPAQPPR